MSTLPAVTALSGVEPGVLYALMARDTARLDRSSFRHAWELDHEYREAVDRALFAAASGRRADLAARPRWLQPFVGRELDNASQRYWSGESFARVRLLERLGLVALEPDDAYVLAMVSSYGPDKAARLRDDPDLVDRALWRLFEVEGGGEVSLANVDRFAGPQWREAFVELTADGTLDRDRVLSACLRTLGGDFLAYRASWFSATFLALEPTLEELAARQDQLRSLLRAQVPPTVAFALKHLMVLHKAGRLDEAETLDALTPAVVGKAKGTAITALRLARALRSGRDVAASQVARAALDHPEADVQRTAANLLAECGQEDVTADEAVALRPGVRADLGLTLVAPSSDVVPEQRLLPAPERVTMAELAERVAALVEDPSDAGELEAVLAALVIPEAADRLAPLVKRAHQVVARSSDNDWGPAWLPGQVAGLVLEVAAGVRPEQPTVMPQQLFVIRRLREIRTSTAPLLATPDLPGGWLSPGALVSRLAKNPQPRHHDLIAALLRLHTEGRGEAAASSQARGIPDAVRYALTGEDSRGRILNRRKGPDAWWFAAERSLGPYADTDCPQLDGEIKTHTWQDRDRTRHYLYAKFGLRTAGSGAVDPDRPTELRPRTDRHFGHPRGHWVPVLAQIWPRDAEHFLALTASAVLDAPGYSEVAHDVPLVLDALARHPGRLGDLAATTLAAGLSSSTRTHRLHAVDAFLDLVPSGRLPVGALVEPLATYAAAWPATRWAESLAAVCEGPGGSRSVVDLLTRLLPRLPVDHRGNNKLLELLRDQALLLGTPLTDPTLDAWLQQFSGRSAAARLAAQLRT